MHSKQRPTPRPTTSPPSGSATTPSDHTEEGGQRGLSLCAPGGLPDDGQAPPTSAQDNANDDPAKRKCICCHNRTAVVGVPLSPDGTFTCGKCRWRFRNYVEGNCKQCFFCGAGLSDSQEHEESGDGLAYSRLTCSACGRAWEEKYEVVGIEEIFL